MICRHMKGDRSKELGVQQLKVIRLSLNEVIKWEREGPLHCALPKTGECYLLIDSKWGIFGREILGVHGSLHHRGHCPPVILGTTNTE